MKKNMKLLIPKMSGDLDRGYLSVTGVSAIDRSKRRWVRSKGFGN